MKEYNALIEKLESELSGPEDILLIAKQLNAMGKRHLERCEYSLVILIVEKVFKLLNSLCPPPSTEFKECCELLYETYKSLHKPKLAYYYLDEIKGLN